jgi:hypothetical protein
MFLNSQRYTINITTLAEGKQLLNTPATLSSILSIHCKPMRFHDVAELHVNQIG